MKKNLGMSAFCLVLAFIFFTCGNMIKDWLVADWRLSTAFFMALCYGVGCLSIIGIIAFLSLARSSHKKDKRLEPEATKSNTLSQLPVIPKTSRLDVTIPEKIGDYYRTYDYRKVKFIPSEDAKTIAMNMKTEGSWELNLKTDAGKIFLYHKNKLLGELFDRVQMVLDWTDKDDRLVKLWLENLGESGNYVHLSFFRNEKKYLAGRETTIVKLTYCLNQDAQDALIGLDNGDKLDFDENYDFKAPEGTVWITYGASSIGRLPKKTSERYHAEGAKAVFLDHLDYDYEKDKQIPYVEIYW